MMSPILYEYNREHFGKLNYLNISYTVEINSKSIEKYGIILIFRRKKCV